jgi:hypothetical protein
MLKSIASRPFTPLKSWRRLENPFSREVPYGIIRLSGKRLNGFRLNLVQKYWLLSMLCLPGAPIILWNPETSCDPYPSAETESELPAHRSRLEAFFAVEELDINTC